MATKEATKRTVSPFKPPKNIVKRFKGVFIGPSKVGKTTLGCQFPKSAFIDCERGAENPQYVALLEKAGSEYTSCSDLDELIDIVLWLMTNKHEYRTIVIDPITVPYNEDADQSSKRLISRNDPTGTEYSRHTRISEMKCKHLFNLLNRLDMNVVVTAHSKTKWRNVGGKLIDEGITFDGFKKLDFVTDLIIEAKKNGKGERVGRVMGSRLDGFKDDDEFPLTYEEFSKRYGFEAMEKEATPTVLATEEQVKEIRRLVDLLSIESDVTAKWLSKAGADNWGEMDASIITKCIEHLKVIIETNGKESA